MSQPSGRAGSPYGSTTFPLPPGALVSSTPVTDVRRRERGRGLRVLDVALLVPAIALGVVLLAVHQADRTGSPVSEMFSPSALASLVPGAAEAGGPVTP